MHLLKVAFTCSITCLLLQTRFNIFSPLFLYRDSQLKYFFFFLSCGNYLTHNVYWMKRNRLDGFRKDREKENKHHLTKVTKIVLIINGSYDVAPLNSSSFFPPLFCLPHKGAFDIPVSWSIKVFPRRCCHCSYHDADEPKRKKKNAVISKINATIFTKTMSNK